MNSWKKVIVRVTSACMAALLFIATAMCTGTDAGIGLVQAKADTVYMGDVISSYGSLNRNTVQVIKESDGAYDIKKNGEGEFKVLQLTDIHFTALSIYDSNTRMAMETVYRMVEQASPDLIVVTGDVIWATSTSNNNEDYEAFRMFLAFMDRIGIPWVWSFGNHDHEFLDRYSRSDVTNMLSKSSTLIQYDASLGISGYSNGEFRLFNSDWSLNSIIVSIDTHNTKKDGAYDYVKEDQIQWYQRIRSADIDRFGSDVQMFLYTHIPVMEYADAWNAWVTHDYHAEYQFGTMRETVCCSNVRTRLGTVLAETSNTKAVFCGHDHLNDYGIKYYGVSYVYGRSIDYTAYGGIASKKEQRGATMLILDPNGVDYRITDMVYAGDQERRSGLQYDYDGIWRVYDGGNVNTAFTGMACNEYGWWYFEDGVINQDYTGMACNEYGWWYFEDGVINQDYTGMACNEYGGWYFSNGRIDTQYSGMAVDYNGEWVYVLNGHVEQDYTGMACNENGWWYFDHGQIDWNYTGMACNENGWWYFDHGQINWNYTGMASNEYGWWYFDHGQINWNYTGIASNEYGWWMFNNGVVDLENRDFSGMFIDGTTWKMFEHGEWNEAYIGMAYNEYGWWYITNGCLNLNYTGIGSNQYGNWYFVNGVIDHKVD